MVIITDMDSGPFVGFEDSSQRLPADGHGALHGEPSVRVPCAALALQDAASAAIQAPSPDVARYLAYRSLLRMENDC